MGDNPHFLDNTDHMSRYGEHHARSEYNSDAPLQNLPKFIGKEEGVKAVGKMLCPYRVRLSCGPSCTYLAFVIHICIPRSKPDIFSSFSESSAESQPERQFRIVGYASNA